MVRVPIVVTASLAAMLGVAVAPTAALAQRFPGGTGGRVVVTPRPFAPHPFASRPFVPHRPFPRPFVRPFVRPFALFGPVVVYATPPVASYPSAYYAPPVSYDPPAVYSAPTAGSVSVAPAPPPTPSVVEYPTGRYELRGDGVTTPYTWVWIPNPPPPPPVAPAPAAPPTGAGASDDPSPPRHTQLYRWTDTEGVVHWTDRWDAVPKQYRAVALDRAPSLH